MKKIVTLFLALAAGVGTMFADAVKIGDLYYNLDATNKTAELTYQERYSNNYPGLTTADIPASFVIQLLQISCINFTGPFRTKSSHQQPPF